MTNPENQPTTAAHEDDLAPSETPGYKVGAKKTIEEYQQLDAGDESLQRWKASLGLDKAGGVAGECKVVVQTLVLQTEGREDIVMDLSTPESLKKLKEVPFVIKEGIKYTIKVTFEVLNDVVSGLRYIQQVSRMSIPLPKTEEMLGSYGPSAEIYSKTFGEDEMPSGLVQRGTYTIRSRFVDDDKKIHLDLEWKISVKKDWQ